jgi:CRISPR-associated exonuclease Cas4
MFTEDNFIHISALQHYVFCPRQCALIHVEDAWKDNLFTIRGELLHERVDTDTYESRGTVKTVRGLRIHSFRLGIVGRCDVVEFHRSKTKVTFSRAGSEKKVTFNMEYEVLPVEFKSGKPKEDISDKVQLCAQALCLEEMLNAQVKQGAFFYGRIRRRVFVAIDDSLREQTEGIIANVHDLIGRKMIPAAKYMQKCKRCSLEEICQPKAMNDRRLRTYMGALYNP